MWCNELNVITLTCMWQKNNSVQHPKNPIHILKHRGGSIPQLQGVQEVAGCKMDEPKHMESVKVTVFVVTRRAQGGLSYKEMSSEL